MQLLLHLLHCSCTTTTQSLSGRVGWVAFYQLSCNSQLMLRLRLRLSWAVTICALKWTFDMRLDSQTYSIYLTLTRRFTNDICFICVQVILISRSSEDLMFSKQLWWIPFYGTIKYFSLELNSTRAITQNVWNLLILLFFLRHPVCLIISLKKNFATLQIYFI